MPRKFFKRHLPDSQSLKQHQSLGWLGKSLEDPNIWHLNRQSVSRAAFIGVFFAFLPIPLQTLLAACFALKFSANLPVAAVLVWLTNPLTFAPIFYLSYTVGCKLMRIQVQAMSFELDTLKAQVSMIWQPLFLGSVVCGVIFGALAAFILWQLWRWQVISRWEERKKLRQQRALANKQP